MDKVLLGIDIDGVFNIIDMEKRGNKINRTPIYYLNRILEAVPNCDVLITSSWGNHKNKTVLSMVEAGFEYPERVIGATGVSYEECSRTKEIVEWLESNNKTDYYKHKVYIDDEIVLFDYFTSGASKREVVVCRPDIGLNIDKAYEVICRLQGISLKFWTQ